VTLVLDLGLGRGLRSPEFEAFGVDQAQSREMFVESFNLIRRILGRRELRPPWQVLDGREERAAVAAAGSAAAPPFLVSAPRPRKSGSH
jgi:alkanesulfonate monooxygenase SsuD/methylene tetrahydromethanopterin reductase-like flavin-dependent oxidoreductase (luciferase family)